MAQSLSMWITDARLFNNALRVVLILPFRERRFCSTTKMRVGMSNALCQEICGYPDRKKIAEHDRLFCVVF